MGYDRGDSLPFDFETNEIPFGSKSKGILSPRLYPIQFKRKWKYSFLSVLWDHTGEKLHLLSELPVTLGIEEVMYGIPSNPSRR